MYGQTETCGIVATFAVGETEPRTTGFVPIGRPLDGIELSMLVVSMSPLPAGEPGCIHVRGATVGPGYLHHPDRSGASWPTGDVGRLRQDGVLECLGRADFQVKIRGFRVELGDVAAAILTDAHVRECVVVARDDPNTGSSLVAYVAPEDVDIRRVREALRIRLPDYMVPNYFCRMPSLPLTLNGKIDRRALPAQPTDTLVGEHVAPRTPMEELIAGTWAELLRRPRIGVHDNFFELGGHSLLATRVVAHLRKLLSIELTVRVLFGCPTVGQLAAHADQARRLGGGARAHRACRARRCPTVVVGGDTSLVCPATRSRDGDLEHAIRVSHPWRTRRRRIGSSNR